ncbi:MAG: hypothetical protein JWL59_388 [Chthoniobacteraceae bacterium]|nr:hypothetical protein [Chthoniobacteraceae bacterium]
MLITQLSNFWAAIPQYEFGWLVPPLAFYFFLRRWKDIPPTAPTHGRGAGALAIACALLLLPAWIFRTAAPQSYHANYLLALLVTGFTLGSLACRAGWAGIRGFVFPVLFIFCAVPWSRHLESPLIEGLTGMVTTVTVELLQLCGIAATRTGNLVSLINGTLDVEEACSGIRSFQSMIMAALALGELHRIRVRPRLLLIAAGAGLSLFFNLLRNFLLAIIASTQGIGAVNVWHDSSGWGIFLVSFYLLNQLANRLVAGPIPLQTAKPSLRPFPAWAGVPIAIWFISILATTEYWYRSHEQSVAETIAVRWPEDKPGYQIQPVLQPTRDILLCSDIQIANWKEYDRTLWAFSAVRWNPGETTTNGAQSHHPEVCLPAAGLKWIRTFPPQRLPIEGGDLLFTISEFEAQGRSVYSFFTFYEESDRKRENAWLEQDFSLRGDIHRALIGRRDLGKQTLEIVVSGYSTYEQALTAVGEALPTLAHFERVKR